MRSREQIMLRRVLVFAIAALVLGASSVAALEVDRALAREGNALPEHLVSLMELFAVAFGVAALALWIVERRRSHARLTVGVLIALFALAATPTALAIARPDDTALTLVAFDARSGRQRWQTDVDLLSGAPLWRDGRNRLGLAGLASNGRCETRPDRFILDPRNGRTLSRTRNAGPPERRIAPLAPIPAGDLELRIVPAAEPDADATLQAIDATGHMAWSTRVDSTRDPAVLFADTNVVAIYVPGTGPDAATPETGRFGPGLENVIAMLDTHTGRRRWTIHATLFATPVFNPETVFTIEGSNVVARATKSGTVRARYPYHAPNDEYADAQLRRAGRDEAVTLLEGSTARLTLIDRSGTVRWTTTLPRAMRFSEITYLDGAIYVAGGGSLGYDCGGE